MGNKSSHCDSDDSVEHIERTTKSEVSGLGPSHNDFEETLKNYENPCTEEVEDAPSFNIKDDASLVSLSSFIVYDYAICI